MLKIKKEANGSFSHIGEFKTKGYTYSDWDCVFDYDANTFVLVFNNNSSYPKEFVPINEIKVQFLEGAEETFTTATQLYDRLFELNYPPLIKASFDLGYSLFEANVVGNGNLAPILVGENINFTGKITTLRESIGVYSLNSNGLFLLDKTFVTFSTKISDGNTHTKDIVLIDKTVNKLTFITTLNGSKSDNIWDLPITISIKVKK